MKDIRVSLSVYRHVEALLYQYPEMVSEIKDIRESIITASAEQPEVYAKASGQSDPTAMMATLLTTHSRLKLLEQATAAIDKVYDSLPPDKQCLIRLKYWDKRFTDTGIAMNIPVAERTVRRWKKQIIKAIAVELGWAKVS